MSVANIKKLHDLTGMSMAVCQKAWKETQNIDKAIDYLRAQGLLKAAALIDRDAFEGIIAIAKNDQKIVMIKVSCETDFTAGSKEFIAFAEKLSQACLNADVPTPDHLPAADKEYLALMASKFRENISLTIIHNIHLHNNEKAAIYLHTKQNDYTCAKACVVKYIGDDEATAYDIAMHIVASETNYLTEQDISPAIITKEKDLLLAKHQGKPESVLAKIAESGMRTFLTNNVLMHQAFIKDDGITVGQLCQSTHTHVISFHRLAIK